LPFSEKKLLPGIPAVSRKRKTSEFHSKPFVGREKPLEFRFEPFSDKKNLGIPFQTILGREKPRNSIPTIFGREKTSEFRSKPFLEKKKLRNSILSQFVEQKTLLKIRSKPFLGTENTR
jgi:hypothetical protein